MNINPVNEQGEIVIDGRIGIDPDELRAVADVVVRGGVARGGQFERGRVIISCVIDDLRKLIEAVQNHAEAKLTPAWRRGDPRMVPEALENVTRLEIRNGTVENAECKALPIRISIVIIATKFEWSAGFANVLFYGKTIFDKSIIVGPASFSGAHFHEGASFRSTRFAGSAWFSGTSFRGGASFSGSVFASVGVFQDAVFNDHAGFDAAVFVLRTTLLGAKFEGTADFRSARFAAEVLFSGASFAERAWFGGASFAGAADLDGVAFRGEVRGDFRGINVSMSSATLSEIERRFSPWPIFSVRLLIILREIFHRSPVALWQCVRFGWPGWTRVRAIGGLSIINRASVVTLFTVPVLAALFLATQEVMYAVKAQGGDVPLWVQVLRSALSQEPYLSSSVTFAFFASVVVSLGLLLYQSNAPTAIKKYDEDEYVREVEARYADENTSLRRDGLRRSIERLEDQAKVRNGRHPRFVKHHGELIWIPPRNRPEWFDDKTLPDQATLERQTADTVKRARERCGVAVDDAAMKEVMSELEIRGQKERQGFVPDFERARICIEEGARAEYWLKAHESIWAAWLSLLCYTIGMLLLACVLAIQCHNVGHAAGWWEGLDFKQVLQVWSTTRR